MKKVMLLAVFVAATSFAHAQVSIGIHGNVIGASMTNKEDGEELNFKNRFSWKGGLVAQVPISYNLNFMPQLNILSKGGKYEESETYDFGGTTVTESIMAKAKLTYVELPLNFVYSTANAEEGLGGFFIGVGPNIGFGISGKMESEVTFSAMGQTETESMTTNIKFDGKSDDELDSNDEDGHLKRLDFGANIIAGYQLSNGLFINAHYTHGFSNINPNEGVETKNRYFGIGIGYFFGRQ